MTSFLSVGIDVGTTSTHLTFTKLSIGNSGTINQSPMPVIDNREIVFESKVHLTPLKSDGTIDAEGVFAIVESEFENAGIKASDITIGAAIVTGETSLKRNAREVLEKLSQISGELVAVSAGPHLEAILSARGSGAVAASLQTSSTILNIDIGGGTMNLALYKNGTLLSTSCIGIGGRCLQFNTDLSLKSSTDGGAAYLRSKNMSAENGTTFDLVQLQTLAENIVSDVSDFIIDDRKLSLLHSLPLTNAAEGCFEQGQIWLSGGVPEFLIAQDLDRFMFLDMGGLLAEAFASNFARNSINYKIAKNPVRATVAGAAMHSMQVSGATIDFDINYLPLRSVPLLKPFSASLSLLSEETIYRQIVASVKRFDTENQYATFAIELPEFTPSEMRYEALVKIADSLASAAEKLAHLRPWILVCRQDLGMALGQSFRKRLSDCPLIIIDGVQTGDGDFIDIGKPVSLDQNNIAQTLPLVLKTLVFNQKHTSM